MRRLFICFLFLLPLRASDFLHGNRSDSEFLVVEKMMEKNLSGYVQEAHPAIDEELTSDILVDYDNRVPGTFAITPYWSPFVRFWFGIYTRFTTSHIVIHDKSDLGIVYGVLDFSNVGGPNVNRFAKSAIIQSISNEKMAEIKKVLIQMSQGNTTSRLSLSLMKVFNDASFPPPTNPALRRKFFLRKAENIRTQTGQRNVIENGIINMTPLAPFLSNLFKSFDLPPQLLAIPFLESSFNNSAHSKVGALGVWQFMPLIASFFMPKRNDLVDYRLNPIISSVGALHLLSENKRILKSWDLAVTAYNSGTRHLVKARRVLKVNSLEMILRRYNHPHLGFASKNFYAEFLALVHTLAYRNEIFPAEKDDPRLDPKKLHIAIAKCAFVPNRIIRDLGESRGERWKGLNMHLRKPASTYTRGTLLITYDFSDKRFMRLSNAQISKTRPIDWQRRYLGNQSCSTR